MTPIKLPWVIAKERREAETRALLEATAQRVAAEVRKENQVALARMLSPLMPEVDGTKHTPPYPLFHYDYPYRYAQSQGTRKKPDSIVNVDTLRQVADVYDILRSCINELKRQVQTTPLQIIARDPDDSSDSLAGAIKDATEWFGRRGGLGGRGVMRRHFEGQVVEDVCVVGSAAVYMAGNLGGTLYEAIPIDSATIKPHVSAFGWQDDDNAYEQWVQGVRVRGFTREELLYDGLWSVSYSPYFKSPVEYLISAITSALKADEWNRTWLTDGSTASDLITCPPEWKPEQVQAFAEYWEALMSGDTRRRQQARVVPGGLKVGGQTRKDADFQEFELWLARRTGAIMGVHLASINFAGEQYKVSQEGSMDSTSAFGVGVLLDLLKTIYDEILEALGYGFLEASYVPKKVEDPVTRTQRLAQATGGPYMSVNEARRIEGLDPIDGGDDVRLMPSAEAEPGEPEPADDEEDDPATKKRAEALGKWERKSLNRMAKFGDAGCDFEDESLDIEIAELIRAELEDCETEDDVRELYRAYNPNQPRGKDGKWLRVNHVAKLSFDLYMEHNGSTVDINGRNLAGKNFWVVGGRDGRTRGFDGRVTEKDIRKFLRDNLASLSRPGTALGTWYNKAQDETWLDVVSIHGATSRAIQFGKQRNQISVFNLKTFKELQTGGTGDIV